MGGESFDYKFGPKNNWRRWAWNRIAERLIVPERDAVVLYLAGAQNADREIAIGHGFKDYNLISIEKHDSVVEQLRGMRVLTVRGDFLEVVQSWPADRRIDVVFGDFCCGLQMHVLKAIVGMCALHHLSSAVFAFNFLRGRDASTNEYRDEVRKSFPGYTSVHRGKFLYYECIKFTTGLILGRWGLTCDGRIIDNPGYIHNGSQEIKLNAIQVYMRAQQSFYKSTSGQVFDSVIWKNPVHEYMDKYMDESEVADIVRKQRDIWKGSACRKNISAILAHRTMRMREIRSYV